MRGSTAIASRSALSAGTLVVFGVGLALYQMTSLVIGPAGSRELHLSLTIPALEDEPSEPKISGVALVLGTLVGPRPADSVSVPSTGSDQASSGTGAHRPAAPAPGPVGSQPPATHPSSHPKPSTVVPQGEEAD